MKITVYSGKGGVGKTPIAYNIAKDRGWPMATNEADVLDHTMAEEELLEVPGNEPFPDLPADMDIVFDLGGTLDKGSAPSILSAIKQSDLVLVPVSNERKGIRKAFVTISEVLPHNQNIAIIVTKLQKRPNEMFTTWFKSADFTEVTKLLSELLERDFPAFPLKFSKVFDHIFEREMSVAQICALGGIDQYHFKVVKEQWDVISNFIDEKNHGAK